MALQGNQTQDPKAQRVKRYARDPRRYVWDALVRICHWVFIGGCLAAYITWRMDRMDWHAWAGYAVLVALIARLVWGLIGSENAKFTSFVRSPAVVWRYVTHWFRQPAPVGHNPLGGYAVLALLTALLVQGVTGLFSDDSVSTTGPLSGMVSDHAAELLTHIHRMAFDALLALVALHLAAICAYALFKRINLVGPMITGWAVDKADQGAASQRD